MPRTAAVGDEGPVVGIGGGPNDWAIASRDAIISVNDPTIKICSRCSTKSIPSLHGRKAAVSSLIDERAGRLRHPRRQPKAAGF
jgi:hypothetical protein